MQTRTDEERYRTTERGLWDAVDAAPVERWLELPGSRTTVRVQEVGEGPPVLFIHGVANSGTSWAPLAARLPAFRCLLLDRPGCGLSQPLATSFDDVGSFVPYAESLVTDVLDGVGLESAHVVATSLGGQFALRCAAARPDRIGRLVQLGWTVGAPIAATPLVMRVAANRRIGRLMTRIPMSTRAARAMLGRIGLRQALDAGRVTPEMVEWFRSQVNDTDTMRNEIDSGPPIMTLRRGVNDDVLLDDAVLGAIHAPTLFLWGAEDPFGGEAIARRFVARVPDARLEMLADAGHAVWLDDPDGVASTVGAFLSATDAR